MSEGKAVGDARHFHLDVDVGNGDSIQINTRDGKHFNIEIDEPMAGDSVSGLGRTCSITLNEEQMSELCRWIGERLGA